jgi:hypothetical protein
MDRPSPTPTRSSSDTRNAGAPLFAFLLMLSVLPSAIAAEPGGAFAERARIVAMGLGMHAHACDAPRESIAVLPVWFEQSAQRSDALEVVVRPQASTPTRHEGSWVHAHSGPAPPSC